MSNQNMPDPVSREEALRVWNLMKQNELLWKEDQEILHQSWEHQMMNHHGVQPISGNSPAKTTAS